MKPGLSASTRPPSFFERGSSWLAGLDAVAAQARIDWHRMLRLAFQQKVQSYLWRDVCTLSALDRLTQDGRYASVDLEPERRALVEPIGFEERRQHLRKAARMLREHPNFHIALLDASEGLDIMKTTWQRVGDTDVFLEALTPGDRGEDVRVNLHITEPTIAGAFRDFGDDLWERIAPLHRDREWVIAQLEQRIDVVDALEREHPEIRDEARE